MVLVEVEASIAAGCATVKLSAAEGIYAIQLLGARPKRTKGPGRAPSVCPLTLSGSINSPFCRGPRYEKHFLVAVLVALRDSVQNRCQRSGQHRRVEELLPGWCPV
jgi:hypothetical protein